MTAKTHNQIDDLIIATCDFIDRRPDDTEPLIGILEAHTETLRGAHIPRVGTGSDRLRDGIMRNPGSQASARAIAECRFETEKAAVLMAVAQGHPGVGEILIDKRGPDWDALINFELASFGYRFEGDWPAMVMAVRNANVPDIRDVRQMEQFAVIIGAPELPAAYAATIWGRVTGAEGLDTHMQTKTPGPVGAAHDLGLGLDAMTRRIFGLVELPTPFDASAAACEIYRVNRHLNGKADLSKKRPRTSRQKRFGRLSNWHRESNFVLIG